MKKLPQLGNPEPKEEEDFVKGVGYVPENRVLLLKHHDQCDKNKKVEKCKQLSDVCAISKELLIARV